MKRGQCYRGKYRPINPGKYDGDYSAIVYRSLWERQVFKWCDENSSVVKWNSEETVVPYRCKTDNKFQVGLGPLSHLPDCNYWHYSLQLNVYRWVLENLYGPRIFENRQER